MYSIMYSAYSESFTSSIPIWMPCTFYFILFCLFTASLMENGGPQARGQIGATAAGLHHSHSNTGSKPHLLHTPQLMTMLDP